jgi:hypothetical protein
VSSTQPKPRLPVVVRAQGITPAERYLQRLCERSFLSLWSYPSVFRDQKTRDKGDGKELSDLLVVFGDDVLIFSDKSCAFPQTGDVQLDWSRWFRKAVMKSAEQTWGAERWLREHPSRVFLDRACTQPLPVDLPPTDQMRVHRLVVAHNVADRCASYFGGGSSGTLAFNSDLNGKDHYTDPSACVPFEVGWLDGDRGVVHVLDDAFLDILLTTRDTVTDFVDYLRRKEDLLHSARNRGVNFRYCGEEDLLANYLLESKDGRHGFSLPDDCNVFFLDEGDWVDFQASPRRAAQLAADKVSYLWDQLIEKFNKNILGGTSYDTTTDRITDREKIMRFFAREPRVRRRMLAEVLLGLVEKTKGMQRAHRVLFPSNPDDPYYCFLVMPHLFGRPREEYRVVRGNLLEALCLVTKVVFPDALDIVGFATEPGVETEPRSEDSLYLNSRAWNEEMEAHARELQQKFGLLINFTTQKDKVAEFPISRLESVVTPGPNPRNKPCPCGSGEKYKKCHGS